MVRSVTVFDEEFTEDDMRVALEWKAEDDATCSGCGFPLAESTAVGRDDAYEAELIVCHGCAAGDRVEKAFKEQDNPDTAGLRRRVWETDD
jgi:hypothetical protein